MKKLLLLSAVLFTGFTFAQEPVSMVVDITDTHEIFLVDTTTLDIIYEGKYLNCKADSSVSTIFYSIENGDQFLVFFLDKSFTEIVDAMLIRTDDTIENYRNVIPYYARRNLSDYKTD